jgi:hypothetical protein
MGSTTASTIHRIASATAGLAILAVLMGIDQRAVDGDIAHIGGG